MKSVANLDENDTYIITHHKQKLLEVLGLGRSLVAKDTSRDLSKSINNLRYFRSEDIFHILHRIVGILHNIMQQSRADACRTKSHLLYCYASHSNWVHDVWLTRKTSHTFVGLPGEVEGFVNYIHLSAVG